MVHPCCRTKYSPIMVFLQVFAPVPVLCRGMVSSTFSRALERGSHPYSRSRSSHSGGPLRDNRDCTPRVCYHVNGDPLVSQGLRPYGAAPSARAARSKG